MKAAPPGPPEKNPKLEMAAKELIELFEKYDIGGIAVIFQPGHVRPVHFLSPSFSCVTINEVAKLQIKPPILDPQNEAAYLQKITDTLNMIGNLRIYASRQVVTLTQAEMATRDHFGVQVPKKPNVSPNKN